MVKDVYDKNFDPLNFTVNIKLTRANSSQRENCMIITEINDYFQSNKDGLFN